MACAALLVHGFQGSPGHLAPLACALRDRGWEVRLPQLGSLLAVGHGALEAAREGAVDRIRGMLREMNGARVLLVGGHSAGAAVVLEACARERVHGLALLLLDPVPWQRTLRAVAASETLSEAACVMLRAPPSAFNGNGAGLQILDKASFAKFYDVLVHQARHGDFVPGLGVSFPVGACLRLVGLQAPRASGVQTLCTDLAVSFAEAARTDAWEAVEQACRELETAGRVLVRRDELDRAALARQHSRNPFL